MVATICHQRAGQQSQNRRQQLTGSMPSLSNQPTSGRSNLPKLYYRDRTDERFKNQEIKGAYFKGYAGGNHGEVPGLRRYDNGVTKLGSDPKTTRLSRKIEVFDDPMPRWLPELLRNHTPPFSKDFPTNLLLSRSKFWPTQPSKNAFFYGKGLKWPKVKHMVVKHPKFIESSPNVTETLWNLKPALKPRSHFSYSRRGR